MTAREKLLTKSLTIGFDNDEIVNVSIENGTGTAIAETKQILVYEPKKGYTIESRQDISTLDENTFKIEVFFK